MFDNDVIKSCVAQVFDEVGNVLGYFFGNSGSIILLFQHIRGNILSCHRIAALVDQIGKYFLGNGSGKADWCAVPAQYLKDAEGVNEQLGVIGVRCRQRIARIEKFFQDIFIGIRLHHISAGACLQRSKGKFRKGGHKHDVAVWRVQFQIKRKLYSRDIAELDVDERHFKG